MKKFYTLISQFIIWLGDRHVATLLAMGMQLLRRYLAGMHPQLTVNGNVFKMITAVFNEENG